MKKSLGLYVHIPFCLKKCNYCDFCSFPDAGGEKMTAYVTELCRRLEQAASDCAEYEVDTLYFGGGTPTLLPLADWERLLGGIRSAYTLPPDCEITCECNPATADLAYLSALRSLGVNRISIGLQSANERELALLGRAHTYEDFLLCFSDARRAGFDNISIDLMYGIPAQTVESFEQTLNAVIALSPEHISAYGLKIEENTPFFAMRSRLSLPDEDSEWEMYLLCSKLLGENGYRKYEISNFAKIGKESRHNLRYWRRQDYLGFGVAAHSCFGGERFGNSRNLSAFLRGEDITAERTLLTHSDTLYEYLILGLRLAEGIGEEDFSRLFGCPFTQFYPRTEELLRQGYMKRENGRIAFTDLGFFLSNAILSDLPDIPEKNWQTEIQKPVDFPTNLG